MKLLCGIISEIDLNNIKNNYTTKKIVTVWDTWASTK